jgi:hypothetical protein
VLDDDSQLASPFLRAVYGHWRRLKGDRPAPIRSELDPTQFPLDALPYVVLADTRSRPFRIRYRLVGNHGVSVFGNYVGRYLDELEMPAEIEAQLHDDFAYCAWACAPVFGRYPWPLAKAHGAVAEYALMPLATEGLMGRFLCAEHVAPPSAVDDPQMASV